MLLHCVAQSRPTLCHPIAIAHQAPLSMGILQARILEWVAMPSSRRSSQPRDQTQVPTLQADSLQAEPQGSPRILEWLAYPFSRGTSQPRNRTRVSCIAGGFFTSCATSEDRRRLYSNIKVLKNKKEYGLLPPHHSPGNSLVAAQPPRRPVRSRAPLHYPHPGTCLRHSCPPWAQRPCLSCLHSCLQAPPALP